MCRGSHKAHSHGRLPGVVDAEAHSSNILPGEDLATPLRPSPALAYAEPTTVGDATIEAAMDVINCTPSPQTISAERRLKHGSFYLKIYR
jgi:hypothetical protein